MRRGNRQSNMSKLRTDLPLKDPRYKKFVPAMQKWQDLYKKTVKLIQGIYSTRALVLDGNHTNPIGQFIEQEFQHDSKSIQYLMKLKFNNGRATIKPYLFDVITAIYVPQNCKFTMSSSGNIIGKYKGKHTWDPSLEDILEESRTIPESKDEFFWKQLLHMSKQPKQFIRHTQEETMTLDGVLLHRVVPISPMYPCMQAVYNDVELHDDNVDFVYVEGFTLSPEVRTTLCRGPTAGWIELDGLNCPFVIFRSGVNNVYGDHTPDKVSTGIPTVPDIPNVSLPPAKLEDQSHLLNIGGKITLG